MKETECMQTNFAALKWRIINLPCPVHTLHMVLSILLCEAASINEKKTVFGSQLDRVYKLERVRRPYSKITGVEYTINIAFLYETMM